MLADYRHALQAHAAADGGLTLAYPNPELTWTLWRGNRTPVIVAVLILTGILTVAALDATVGVYENRLHLSASFAMFET
jgi:hypothetical protein